MRENGEKFLLVAASMFKAASMWIVSVLITVTLGAAALGEFAYALAFLSPIFIVSEMALRNIYVTLRARPSLKSAFTLRIISLVLAASVSLCVSLLDAGPDRAIVVALVAAKTADSLMDLSFGLLQRDGRLLQVAQSATLAGTLIVVSVGITLFSARSVAAAVWMWAAASIMVFVAVVVPVTVAADRKNAQSTQNRAGIKELLSAGIPSGIAQGVSSLVSYTPVLALGLWSTPDETGKFAALSYFVTAINLAMVSMQQAFLPGFAAQVRRGQSEVASVSLRYGLKFLLVGLVAALLVLAAGNPILATAFGQEFEVHFRAIVFTATTSLALAPVFAASAGLLVMNAYRLQSALAIAVCVVVFLVTFMLRGQIDVATAALIVLITTLCRALFNSLALGLKLRAMGPS